MIFDAFFMNTLDFRRFLSPLLCLGVWAVLMGCQSSRGVSTGVYRLDESGGVHRLRIDNFGFYGVTLPLSSGDRSATDPVVLSGAFRGYLSSWVENLRAGGGTDYRYYEPIYLRTEEGFDFAIIPGEMSWLRRSGAGGSDAFRESLELKQSRMRVEETFSATPKDQLVRFLRFGVFRFEKGWFASNGWAYGAEEGAGGHVYFYASNPEGSARAAEQRIILGLKNEFLMLLGTSEERDRAAMNAAINALLADLSFRKK